MKPRTLSAIISQPGNIVLVFLVAAAFTSAIAVSDRSFTPFQLILLCGLGVIFTLFGFLEVSFFQKYSSRYAAFLYFTIQLLIVGAILYLSRVDAWLLVLLLTGQSVVYLTIRGIVVVNTVILGMILINFLLLTDQWRVIIQAMVAFSAAVLFVILFTQIAKNERKARAEVERLAEQLSAANQQLREYANKVEELAAFHERNRLAREIHDGLGHYLTTINIQIKAASVLLVKDVQLAERSLGKAQVLCQDALNEVRRSVATLRGGQYLNRPLIDLIEELAAESRVSGLVANLEILGEPRSLISQIELALYRAAQEGLTNVSKHSLASKVDLRLEFGSGLTRLTICDNGVGSSTSQIDIGDENGGFGLFGLRERIQLLGGLFEIQTSPQHGFKLIVEVPNKGYEIDPNPDR